MVVPVPVTVCVLLNNDGAADVEGRSRPPLPADTARLADAPTDAKSFVSRVDIGADMSKEKGSIFSIACMAARALVASAGLLGIVTA